MKKLFKVRICAFLLIGALAAGLPTAAYASTDSTSVKTQSTEFSDLDNGDDWWNYGISLNKEDISFHHPGKTARLKVTEAYPENQKFVWSSSDSKVAKVSSDGLVTAVGQGYCTITASMKDHPDVTETCDIWVENYSVIYHYGNGQDARAKYYTGYEEITLKAPKRKGYNFEGWYKDKSYTKRIKRISAYSSKNYELYAKWKKTKKPGKPSVQLKSSSAGKLKISIRKKVSGASGYQIIVSKDRKLKKGNKTVSISNSSKTLSGLTAGAKYYVKVRAYTSDSTGHKLYGSYSKTKSLNIKKAAKKAKTSYGSGGTVYITKTGDRYHQGWCGYLRRSKISISKSQARSLGYTPCKVCRP